jgi:hypothetical protein
MPPEQRPALPHTTNATAAAVSVPLLFAALMAKAHRHKPRLTTAVTTTQTTTGHHQHTVQPGRAADRGQEIGLACFWGSRAARGGR